MLLGHTILGLTVPGNSILGYLGGAATPPPIGYQTVAVNQQPSNGSNYPFLFPSPDVRYLLGDLYLAYDDDAGLFAFPFRVAKLTGFGTGNSGRRDMIIVDANNMTVIDTTGIAQYTDSAWGTNLRTLSWVGAAVTLRCTIHIGPPLYAPAVTWANSITPANGVLDARAYYRMPLRVRSIIASGHTFTGNVVLSAGFNIRLQQPVQKQIDGGRLTNMINIRAQPGDGAGQSPGCAGAETRIMTINGVAPTTDGDFTLDTDGCYRIQRPVLIITPYGERAGAYAVPPSPDSAWLPTPTPDYTLDAAAMAAALQLFNDCGPCCECDDFVRTYEGLRRLDRRFRQIADRANNTRDLLLAANTRWNAQLACRQAQPLRLLLQPQPGYANGVFVGGTFCNSTEGCLSPVIIRATFEGYRGGVARNFAGSVSSAPSGLRRAGTDTGYVETPFVPGGTWPVLDTVFDNADPQASSRFYMQLLFASLTATDALTVTLTAHVKSPAINPVTGARFPLSPISVPTAISSIWTAHGSPPPYPAVAIAAATIPLASSPDTGRLL